MMQTRRMLWIGAGLATLLASPSWGRPLLTGVAGTPLAAVAVGEGTIFFAPQTHQSWAPAGGVDDALTYTAVIAASDGFFIAVAEDGSAWRSSSPSASAFVRRASAAGAPLRAITQIGSQLLAVGDGGTVVRSSDLAGGSWVAVSIPTTENLRAVATNGTTSTVAVGENGTILRGGVPGNVWQRVTIAETRDFFAITVDPSGRFLAVGEAGAMWSAPAGGTSWTPILAGISENLRGAAQLGLVTVLVGDQATGYYASSNFANWQLASTPVGPYNLYGVASTVSDMLAVGTRRVILWSSIGLQWQENTVVPVREQSWGRVKVNFQETAP